MPRYNHTDASDELLRQAYASRSRAERKRLKNKAVKLFGGIDGRSAYSRAVNIGAVRLEAAIQHRPWTPDEITIVETWAHHSTNNIARKLRKAGFSRSESAVSRYIGSNLCGKRQARIDGGLFSASAVAEIIGCESKNVRNWIKRGLLKAKPSGIHCGESELHEVTVKDLRDFIISNPQVIHGDKADMTYLVDILTNRQAG